MSGEKVNYLKTCAICSNQIITNKRLSPIRKGELKGKFVCADCQKIRLRRIKTKWMRDALKNPARRDKYIKIRNEAKDKYFERNPDIKKAREFIKSVNYRVKKYGGDYSNFRRKHTQEFAKKLMMLPEACIDCGTKEDLTVEHIIPLVKDVSKAFEFTNLTTKCRSCNARGFC